MFKACLLILKTGEKKRFLPLDEVQKILINLCKDQEEYSQTVKYIVYLGIKIIINSGHIVDDNFLKGSLIQNDVYICQKIFLLILSNSFRIKGS